MRKPPAPAGFFREGRLYGDGGQPRVVVPPRHQHALFHATLQLALHGIEPPGKAPGGVLTRQLLLHQGNNVLTGSVRVTACTGAFQAMLFINDKEVVKTS